MSDTSTQQGNRRRRGGRNRSQSPRTQGSGGLSRSPTPRAGVQQPSGFQKFLSAVTFGLFGKPQALPRAATKSLPAPATRADYSANRPPREAKPRREAAPVNIADITTDRLYVGNLSYDATESDLFELFSGLGSVRNAEVVVNNRTQRSKGFAFVTMGSVDEARRAVQELHGKDFMSRPLQLSGAKPLGYGDERGPRDSEDSEES